MQIIEGMDCKSIQNDIIVEAVLQGQLVHGDNEPVGEKQIYSGIVPENFKVVN